MKTQLISKIGTIAKKVGMVLGENSPAIFTGVAVIGVVSTIVLTIKATADSEEIINDEINATVDSDNIFEYTEKMCVFRERVKLARTTGAWKCYIPVAISGSATIAAIVSSYIVQKRRIGALALLYSGAIESAEKYQEKVKELIGKTKEEKVRTSLVDDDLNENPVRPEMIIPTRHGDTLCKDGISGRYFRSDINYIKNAMAIFNNNLIHEDWKTLNEWYAELDLDPISIGDYIGWGFGKLLDLHFTSGLTTDGTPCLVIGYPSAPRYDEDMPKTKYW